MPFAGYKDFDECVRKNKDKKDPEAYCAEIKKRVEKFAQSPNIFNKGGVGSGIKGHTTAKQLKAKATIAAEKLPEAVNKHTKTLTEDPSKTNVSAAYTELTGLIHHMSNAPERATKAVAEELGDAVWDLRGSEGSKAKKVMASINKLLKDAKARKIEPSSDEMIEAELEPVSGKELTKAVAEELKKFKSEISNLTASDLEKKASEIIQTEGIVRYALNGWYRDLGGSMGHLDAQVSNLFKMDDKTSRPIAEKGKYGEVRISLSSIIGFSKLHMLTQKMFELEGKKTVTMYRGVDGNTFKKFVVEKTGADVDVECYNISSWSEDPKLAEKFAKEESGGVVLKTEIPVKQIFLHHKIGNTEYPDEKEMIVLGNKIKAEIIQKHQPWGKN